MLSKNRRIPRKVFDEIFRKTKLSSTDFFTIRFLREEKIFPTRFGIVVSKKVSLKAVKRNLIKRGISSVLEKVEKRLKNSYYILLFPKKSALDLSFAELEREVFSILSKIKVIE